MSGNRQITAQKLKFNGPAYALWLFLGGLGAHRFYLNRPATGAAIAAINLVAIPLWLIGIGILMHIGLAVWVVVDAFLIPKWVAEHNTWVAVELGSVTEDDIIKE